MSDTLPTGELLEILREIGFWNERSEVEAAHLQQTYNQIEQLYNQRFEAALGKSEEIPPVKDAVEMVRFEFFVTRNALRREARRRWYGESNPKGELE